MGRRLAPVALALLIAAALPSAAQALCTQVQRNVTTTNDVVDPSDGQLSLREAIAAANADPATTTCEDVLLPAGHYIVTSGPLTITTQNIVLLRPATETTTFQPSSHDIVIDGGGTSALFVVNANTNLQVDTLTLANATRALVNSSTGTHLSRVTISGNNFGGNGGAILNNAGAQLDLEQSTLTDNHATGGASGGAVMNSGGLYIGASTFVGNRVDATGSGGAIYNAGTLTVAHSTLSGNTAPSGPDVFNYGASIAQTQDSLFGSGCNAKLTPVGAEGLSISSDGTCAATTGDLKLGPLQDNGGPTDTEALLPGSPAIDAYGTQCLGYDQRGVRTPQGPFCDSGAYELVESGDLALQAAAATTTVSVGSTTPLDFLVSSLGTSADTNLGFDAVYPTVTSTLPNGVTFAGGSAGCSASGQTVTCAVGKVTTTGPAVPVTIDVRADAPGTFPVTGAVSAPRPDVSPVDDQATITVTATAPPPPPQAKVALVGRPKVSGDRVRFTLACSDAPCAGDARLLVKERLRRHHVVAVLARTVTLGRRAFTIAAGQRSTLTLRLSKSGRALLKRFRMPARLSVRVGRSQTSAAIVFKRKR